MSDPAPPPGLPPSAWGAPPEPSIKGPLIVTIVAAVFVGLVFGLGVLALRSGVLEPAVPEGPVPVPTGRAAVVPPTPAGKILYLAPLDGTNEGYITELARFYGERYGIEVRQLPPANTKQQAWDTGRGQLVGEDAMAAMAQAYQAEAADPAAVVIGITVEDLYLRTRPDWAWAFGVRSGDGRLAVVSMHRMTLFGGDEPSRRMSRLRKMVGKDIGLMYYGLAQSVDPKSMVYINILGVDDLDRMGEEF